MKTFYGTVNSRRKIWFATAPTTKEQIKPGSEEMISRMLCLRFLELPVKGFIEDGLSRAETKNLGQEAVDTLVRNTDDEVRHDEAFNNAVAVLSNYTDKYEYVIKEQILPEWDTLPDHPILKALTLENGIFFLALPLFRHYGGVALSTVAGDVSVDEVIHVLSHRQVVHDMGHKPSAKLDALRKATVAFLIGTFADDHMNPDKALAISDNLYYKGVTDALEFNKTTTTPAFFEIANDSLSYYS